MSLEKEPNLEQFEDDAEAVADGDKNVDDRDIDTTEVDPAPEVVKDAVLGQVDANKENADAKKAKEEEARKLAEAKSKTEEEARIAALDQKLEGAPAVPNAKPQVRISTPEPMAPAATADVAQGEIADEQKEIAERSGALLAEGKDESET